MINKKIIKKLFPKRQAWGHKGDFGKLLVIGGNKRYSGSPAFSAIAALKSGSDLVTIAAPERPANIMASFSPDIITEPLKGDFVKTCHLKTLLELSEWSDAVVVGGGLGRNPGTFKLVAMFLEKLNKPCVVDADAIHAVAKKPGVLKKQFILTPHSQEFFILTNKKPAHNIEERKQQVKTTASELKATILLKGHIDIISDGVVVETNETGNPYMTVGGTGDTITGICGAMLAKGADTLNAACIAACVNGLSGDLAAKKLGMSMTASDLLNEIPNAWKKLC